MLPNALRMDQIQSRLFSGPRAGQILSAALALALAVPAQAATVKKPVKPTTHASSHDSTFHVNPTTLRQRLITDDTNVLESLNEVYQAKEAVNIARGNLLPSINISGTLSGLASGPSFALSSISILLPFLMPSNWYNLDISKEQLSAEGYSYYAVELNEYASALATYELVLNEMDLRNVYQHQYEIYAQLQNVVTIAVQLNKDTIEDLQEATGNTEAALALVLQYDEKVAQETAAIRRMLNLNQSQDVVFDGYHPSASPFEDSNPTSILNKVYPHAPEYLQISSLVAAGQDAASSQTWAFLGSPSVSVAQGTNGSFGSGSGSGGISLGFGYFSGIEAKNLTTDNLLLQERAVKLQLAQTIESAINSIFSARQQVTQLDQAETNLDAVVQSFIGQYALGRTDLQKVLDTALLLTQTSYNRALAQNDLDNQRINLMRVTISSVFQPIPGCTLTGSETGDGGFFGWLTDLFEPSSTEVSVDQVCRITKRASSTAAPSGGNYFGTSYPTAVDNGAAPQAHGIPTRH